MVNGKVNLGITVKGKAINHLRAKVNVGMPHFIYVLNRGKSGINRFNFNIDAKIDSPSTKSIMATKDIKVNVSKINFALKIKTLRKLPG